MINIAIIGAGNISNTRHIPAVLKNNTMQIKGVISDDPRKITRTVEKYTFIKNTLLVENNESVEEIIHLLNETAWFRDEVDAVIIGTPPHAHYLMVKACLMLNKHVLVEKPMMMTVEQCVEVNVLADEKNRILNVMHSFQFASGIEKLDKMVNAKELGDIESIVEIQLTNRNRRLPVWYNNLPLGLFYDEAAHFFYGAIRFGGNGLRVLNAHAQFGKEKENTPKFLQAQMMAGETPVQMFMNFNSPICEWGLLLLGTEKIAIYDYFKDILIIIDNDGQHLAKDVLKVSLQFFVGFWKGFVKNGFKMITKDLLYGHDVAIKAFGNAILTGKADPKIDKDIGLEVVAAMNQVVAMVARDAATTE